MASSSSPSSPNDPPFSLSSAIRLVFSHASSMVLSRLRTALRRTPYFDHSTMWFVQHEGLETIPGTSIIHRMPVPPIQNLTTRVTYYNVPQWRTNALAAGLPLHYNDFDVEMQMYHQPLTRVSMGKTFMGLTFQAAIALMSFSFQSSTNSSSQVNDQPHMHSLNVVKVAVVIGFGASFIGTLLSHIYPSMAQRIEKVGSMATTMGFFGMMSLFLPANFMWIGWLVSALSLLAFLITLIK